MMNNQRNYYRIAYPAGSQPVLTVNGVSLSMIELSAGGGRVSCRDAESDWFSNAVKVSITFLCKQTIHTEAKLLRVDGDQIVLSFNPTLPLPMIMQEQRLLLRLFPKE
jgi:hypothetical protein